MPTRLQRRLEQQSAQSIDLSPLLDVVFILLIFFIVTTVFVKETGVEVDKPQAISAQKLPQIVVLLAITAAGEVFYDGANIGGDNSGVCLYWQAGGWENFCISSGIRPSNL